MLELFPIKTNDPSYSFVEKLLNESFPEEERRDDDAQRENTDHNPLFTPYLIRTEQDGEQVNIGIITTWSFGDFNYVEHLATSPNVRNKGYGGQIMDAIKKELKGLIVLEVEEPLDELTKRRVGFYSRNGFKLCNKDYIQPAYRPNGESIPLKIMYYGIDNLDDDFARIVKTLYKEVYKTY